MFLFQVIPTFCTDVLGQKEYIIRINFYLILLCFICCYPIIITKSYRFKTNINRREGIQTSKQKIILYFKNIHDVYSSRGCSVNGCDLVRSLNKDKVLDAVIIMDKNDLRLKTNHFL